ncbi:MAG: DNA polymerase IV [Chthoniobacterales bacterium]|nr:DNA polymerase IV [Chthoniobacterales bacterium]
MKVIHLDMDCFYAAVEMRERPDLANLPLAVGGGSRRGVVTTCNYEARKYGVRSAMPGFLARERCPQLVFLPVRFDLYRAESTKIRNILHRYTPLVEPLSLDEAYLDVSASDRYAWDIAKEIRKSICDETGLTASAGIAPNKMLAKIASDWRKPNGQFAITPDQVEGFMKDLPLRKIWGIGPKSAERFAGKGIQTCGDLQKLSLPELVRQMGKWGEELYHLCRGRDDRAVEPNRIRKSLSTEQTYLENLTSAAQCERAMEDLVSDLLADIQMSAADRRIHKAFVKIKFADFSRTTREGIHPSPDFETFRTLLLEAWKRKAHPIRLLGAGVRFAEEAREFEDAQQWLDF